MIGSFFMNTYFTYRTKVTLNKFFQFPLTYIVNFIITTISIYVLVDVLNLNQDIAPLIASVIAIPFTFAISKKILVTKKRSCYLKHIIKNSSAFMLRNFFILKRFFILYPLD